MILVITFVSIFLSCPTLLCSATYVNTSKPICPQRFSCQDFGPFSYPFYNTTDTRCGLIKVDCTMGNETIQFGGNSYVIVNKYFGSPSVSIQNTTFQKLVDTKSCEALMNNFTSPTPHLFSISIAPLVTLFKCPKHPNYSTDFDAYFDQPDYISYKRCKHHNVYYKHPISTTPVPSDLPHSCEVIQLPGRVERSVSIYTDIFSFLTSQFFISFWSPSCNECRKKDNCLNHENFECLDAKKDKKLKLILALTGSALIIVLLTAVFIILHRYKNNPFSYFLSKDKSLNPEDASFFFGVSVFSYTELEDATKNFDPSHELGDGGFGAVYYGKLQDGREVAVKRLYDHNYKRVQHFINEVEILTKLRHPHLVLLYGCTSRQSQELLLVYEYIPNGTVADHLHGEQANPGLLPWSIRMKIAIETASALVYLHASEIIHRDVKTNNILLDHNFCVKVADFGLSRLIPNNVTHVSTAPQGTPGYLDPQYHQRYQLTDKSDVYSFGVVLIELISSMAPVDLSRSQDDISLANLALNRIQRCAVDQLIDPVLGSKSNPEIKNMITSVAELAFRCLQFDSEMRPTMNEVFDVLMEIQAEKMIDDGDNIRDLKTMNPPPLSEITDSAVLLKDFPPSPVSVTGEWQSSDSASFTLSSNGDRLSVNIV
ncbi:LEAF RUST 10 DISEASE-RESISTANCE LOCUS RECEPTOR-LIKE PROTEIN KINASE-like 1.1 [Helianthus annuus]|uniref:Putative serine/threonine/dual specificity protein kinase, catalytic domain-containing protein n=1 Tax=Helianthus annuus TaxID=4232 RepID=A0A251RQL2_HELAN|nr:LEAF RUST 10 DISEASE-RESISTANCE LOCUS RECEPTOR-LIKE PROTEIN KINASE-like 1.1 [Helianthus annuus]